MRNYISGSFSSRRSRPLALSIMRLWEQIGLCNKSSLGTQLGWIKLTSRSPNPFALLPRPRPDIVGINRYKFSRIPSRIRSEWGYTDPFFRVCIPSPLPSVPEEEGACTRSGVHPRVHPEHTRFMEGLYEWSILQSEYFAEFEFARSRGTP